MAKPSNTETKLSAARTRLILDKPFLGALVLRLPMKEADPAWCDTTATDARAFYYNRGYIDMLSLEETQFILAHEALHCALSHFVRRQHRHKGRWDIACDYAINPLLIQDGLKPPPAALYLEEYEGMTAEEIYPFIEENSEEGPMDQHLYDDTNDPGSQPPPEDMPPQDQGKPPPPEDERDSPPKQQDGSGDGQQSRSQTSESDKGQRPQRAETDDNLGAAPKPPPLNQSEAENLAVQWQQRLAGAAQQAMQAGKLSGSMARLVDHLLQPQLPWRMLLARYMNTTARDDYSFTRPSSRRQGDAILPSLKSQQIDVVVVMDTSGSVSEEEMQEFLSEINALKGQLRARITLHACDEVMDANGPWIYEPWEELKLPKSIEGGGGTNFIPAFDWAGSLDQQPDLFVYFTDAEGEFPSQPPPFPVIWLVKGKTPVPWGQRIQLN